ncbi:MAG: sugar ABC transporter permease [Clostridia bacterium]|nr:sugar ABC transporter permease [Clostridia bacterium]
MSQKNRRLKNKGASMRTRETLAAWGFLAPNIAVWALVYVFAAGVAVWLSFQDWDLLSPPKFAGFSNYVKLFTNDPDFKRAAVNTLYYVVGIVPIGTVISLLLAIVMNQELKGITFFRTAFYMPVVTSTVAISVVWVWMFNPDRGLFNYFLNLVGVQNPPGWIYDTVWSKPAVIIENTWHYVGYYMVLFLGGLQGIPAHLYEAAEVDGASGWEKFWKITLPLLSPTTFLVVILRIIGAFQIFEEVYVMTEGGPWGSTESLVYFIYTKGFRSFKMGYASAAAIILFAVIFVFTLIQFKLQKNWVNYE